MCYYSNRIFKLGPWKLIGVGITIKKIPDPDNNVRERIIQEQNLDNIPEVSDTLCLP